MLRKGKTAALFGKNIAPACKYCLHCDTAGGLHCTLGRGKACGEDDSCRRFAYDPLLRVPQIAPPLPDVDPEDFAL